MKAAILAALFVLLALPSVAETAAGDIEKAKQQFVEAVNTGDTVMIGRMYTQRAVVLPPNADVIQGSEAIQSYWRGVIAAGLRILSMRSVRIDEYGGEVAREVGRFVAEPPQTRNDNGRVEGKYVILWRKSAGEWQHDTDIWNFTDLSGPNGTTGSSATPAPVGTTTPSPSR
jgi:ketosteroid isomerase-like protein